MTKKRLTLERLPGAYAAVRLGPEAEVPAWASRGEFTCITRTRQELSLVCAEQDVPPGARAERGLCCLRVDGPLSFSEVGVLSTLAGALAEAGISLLAVSTYDTDYLFVSADREEAAVTALTAAGHAVRPHAST